MACGGRRSRATSSPVCVDWSHCRTGFRATQEIKSGTRAGLCVRLDLGANSHAATLSTMLPAPHAGCPRGDPATGRSVGTTRANIEARCFKELLKLILPCAPSLRSSLACPTTPSRAARPGTPDEKSSRDIMVSLVFSLNIEFSLQIFESGLH
jgi:hypothetical protein